MWCNCSFVSLLFLFLVFFLVIIVITGADQDKDWWKKTVVYQIYPRSFQDSDGDGIGDLKGIRSRLDHFEYLGVETLWLSPIYKSPFKDFGYDITDHKDIDPIFGTMEDFDGLLEDVHERGMFLIMDFIPNHTSDEHPWFKDSCRRGNHSDWYRWADGKVDEEGNRQPPNNWLSVFGQSSWTWHPGREQFYLHQFIPGQPDLDFRNPAVREAMEEVLRFWTEKGVDGFRVDAIQTLFEVEDLSLNEPRSFNEMFQNPMEHMYLKHIYTMDQPEIHKVTLDWRKNVFDPIDDKTGKHTFMVMETYNPEDPEEAMKYYDSGSDMPFNFNLIAAHSQCYAKCYKNLIDNWMKHMPKDKWPNFVLGNHDQRRVSTRKGSELINALNILLMTLPGTPTTYYGEELGMMDIQVSYEDTQDPWGLNYGENLYAKYSRDPERAPMQWTDEKNAGFSSSQETWLPVNPDYAERNVEAQKDDECSPLEIYRRAVQVRRHSAFQDNNAVDFHLVTDDVLCYVREGEQIFIVVLNLGVKEAEIDVSWDSISRGVVELNTGHVDACPMDQEVSLRDLSLLPGEGCVIKLIADDGRHEL